MHLQTAHRPSYRMRKAGTDGAGRVSHGWSRACWERRAGWQACRLWFAHVSRVKFRLHPTCTGNWARSAFCTLAPTCRAALACPHFLTNTTAFRALPLGILHAHQQRQHGPPYRSKGGHTRTASEIALRSDSWELSTGCGKLSGGFHSACLVRSIEPLRATSCE